MMEFWLSGSLSHELFPFSRWNSGYQEAFHTNFFFFSRWNSGYQEASSHELFLFFHDGILAIKKPLHEFFLFSRWNSGYQETSSHDRIHKMHDLGEDSFHIYHKEYLHRIRLVKNLAS
jgi:hypothetical protein